MNQEREYWLEFMRWVASMIYEGAQSSIEAIRQGPSTEQERLRFSRGTLMLHELNLSDEQLEILREYVIRYSENTLHWFLAKLEQPPSLSTEIDRLTISNLANGQTVEDPEGFTLYDDLAGGFLAYQDELKKRSGRN